MSVISVVILIFSLLGAVDFLIGNRLGIGDEFKKAFSLFSAMALSMLGMIVISPAIGAAINPLFEWFYAVFGIDPSIIPASLLANDMGGMTIAQDIYKNEAIGNYNAFITSSMMGCAISFTLPFSLGMVKKEQYNDMFLGILSGIATIPFGCFVAGLMCRIPALSLLINLLPLIVIGALIALALILFRSACIKCFTVFGNLIRILSVGGLLCAVFTFLTKIEICKYFDSFENAALICANACVTLSGALPFMFIISKLLDKPLRKLGERAGINTVSAVSLLGTLVTNASTFGVMERMDKRGVVINSAFAVSASFVFGSHLAFTMAFDSSYIAPMIVGKLLSGVCAVILAVILCSVSEKSKEETAKVEKNDSF